MSHGDGAAWTGDFRDGHIVRVDGRTNAVTATRSVAGVQALAAGAGSAWVSLAGASRDGILPAALCSGVESGGAAPDVLIASNLPLRGADTEDPRANVDAIRWVLKDHGFRAGRYVVGYRSCDDATAQTGAYENRRCAANANAFARAERLVAVIGPFNSFCAGLEIPILNRAPGGPLALVSPSNSAPELTRGPPEVLYPTGVRNYARVIGRVDVEGVAHALFAQRLGLSRVYLLEAGQADSRGTITGPFRRTAGRLGIGIAGSDRYDPDRKGHAALAERVARARADGVVIDGSEYSGGATLVAALRRRLGTRVAILVSDQFDPRGLLESAGLRARGVYRATTEAYPDGASLTPAGARFVASLGAPARQAFALNAAEAAEVVLKAIARSDGTRASVLRSLRSLRVKDGILGTFAFDRYGDITPASVTIVRVTGDAVPDYLRGAVVERVIAVPASLSG